MRHHTRSTFPHNKGTNTGLTGQDHIPAVTDTEVTARVIHREVTPVHITDIHTEAHLTTDIQTLIVTDGTHHIGGLHCIEVLLHILEITVGLNHNLPKTTCMMSSKPSYSSNKMAWKHKDKKYKQVTIDDPHLIITALMNHPVSQRRT